MRVFKICISLKSKFKFRKMHKSKSSIHQLENIIPVFSLVINYNPLLPNENQLLLGNITNVSIAST